MRPELSRLAWRVSTHSGGQGECVEVAAAPDGGRYLRDSKDRPGGAQHIPQAAWHAFTRDIRDRAVG